MCVLRSRFSFGSWELLCEQPLNVGRLSVFAVAQGVLTMLFASLIVIAVKLPQNFENYYVRARWLGILAGAIGFPVLSFPAFLAVARLAKYRRQRIGVGN